VNWRCPRTHPSHSSRGVTISTRVALYHTLPMIPQAFISWPSAPFTETLVRKSLADISWPSTSLTIPASWSHLLQWSTYDDIDHELTHSNPRTVLSSSYTIRKALIRKHFLSRCVQAYLKKRDSPLKDAVPRTWDFEISFADELEEMWNDELWDLGQEMGAHRKWWILKPGMADRGMGVRLFSSKEGLQRIFEEFELNDVSDEGSEEANPTAVITSQLRHFVIQASPPFKPTLLGRALRFSIGICAQSTSPRPYASSSKQPPSIHNVARS
jgi:tubulin--tyrosine ligase